MAYTDFLTGELWPASLGRLSVLPPSSALDQVDQAQARSRVKAPALAWLWLERLLLSSHALGELARRPLSVQLKPITGDGLYRLSHR